MNSTLHHGTTFLVKIPTRVVAQVASPTPHLWRPNRQARLLVLEDEPAITRLLSRALGGLGYDFDLVVDGQSAVHLARQSLAEQRPYDLLVFDLTIRGGVGGREALRSIRTFAAHPPAIATTGYSVHSTEDLQHEGFAEVLPKPYTIDQLAQIIDRRLLARA